MIRQLKKLRSFLQRKFIYRRYDIDKGFHAGKRVKLWAKTTLKIGKDFYIGRDSLIETDCIIGDNVIFGNKVGIVGKYDHHYQQVGNPVRKAMAIRDWNYNWTGLNLVTKHYFARCSNRRWRNCSRRFSCYQRCITLFHLRRQPS